MRPANDRRPAKDFKAGQLARLARESSIAIVVDDDPEVVAKLRKLGHPVQLADWVPRSSILQSAQEREGRTYLRRGRGELTDEQGLQRVGGHRAGEQEALRISAVQLAQGGGLLRGLDALGDRLQVQAAGQLDHGAQERVRPAGPRPGKRTPGRSSARRSGAPQVCQRRVPGAEVVDGDPDAVRPQRGEPAADRRRLDVAAPGPSR